MTASCEWCELGRLSEVRSGHMPEMRRIPQGRRSRGLHELRDGSSRRSGHLSSLQIRSSSRCNRLPILHARYTTALIFSVGRNAHRMLWDGVSCVVLYAAFSPSAPTVRTVPKADIETSITIEGACAKSRSALYNLKRAAASGDREAIAGLILRGEAIQVSPSDTVHVISSDGEGVSHVRMLSGFQIGNSCYLPASMLR